MISKYISSSGEKLLCNDMQQFSEAGSAGQLKLYWAPESGCSLVKWQTAFSALVEGDHAKCKGETPSCNNEAASTTSSSGSSETTSSITTGSSSTAVSTNPTTSSELIGSSCSGTICGRTTNEPITDEIRNQRETASCTLDNDSVEAIQPLASSNPQNVKNVEAIFPESKFNEFFPNRNSAYTYTNFLRAIGKYPSICSDSGLCPKILTNMFGHIKQETADLYYIEEINKGDYCKNFYNHKGAKVNF